MFLNGETSNAGLAVDIHEKIVILQNDIHIVAISGNGQTCNYGNKLAEPLVVELHHQNKLLGKCPLKAIYTRGTGQLRNSRGETGTSISIYTDLEGKGYCWVDAVKSISHENRIQVTADSNLLIGTAYIQLLNECLCGIKDLLKQEYLIISMYNRGIGPGVFSIMQLHLQAIFEPYSVRYQVA